MYVGRLHQLHDNKQVVKVYDYVDRKEELLLKMYEKRLKGYRSLGYRTKDIKDRNQNHSDRLDFLLFN
jgi:DNA repair ATPase RecN